MKTFTISGPINTYTSISNIFIDEYMLEAHGEFVKVYLLLIRLLTTNEVQISTDILADKLNLTESDVVRALKYWDYKKVISLTMSQNTITGLVICDLKNPDNVNNHESSEELAAVTKEEIKSPIAPSSVPKQEANLIAKSSDERLSYNINTKPQYSNNQILTFKEDESYEELIMVAEKYLGPLSQPDLATLISFHDWLSLPIEVIDILIEFCVSNNNKRMRYIEKVAIDWAEKGINNANKAIIQSESYNKNYYAIKKALGLSAIQPVEFEIKLMDKWLNTYGYAAEIVLEACNRTMEHAPTGGFKYTDSIIESWHNNKVKSLIDINKLDETYNTKQKKTSDQKSQPKRNNKFTDYDQRVYDFDKLEKRMLELRLKETSKGSYK